jgi:Flp pilus assembly protein TadD
MVEMYRGRARVMLDDLDGAEAAWTRALDLDPTVPEAGWGLLDLYYLQWRTGDADRLALRLHGVEPDARDRVRLLLEIIRQEIQRLSPRYVVQWFEPKHRRNPADRHAAMALGRALVRDGRIDEGLTLLRRVVADHPDDPEAWDALLTGLDEGGAEPEVWSAEFDRLPRALAGTPRFAKHRARGAQDRLDWPAAAAEFRRAVEAEPGEEQHQYRLARVLRIGGHVDEASRIEQAIATAREARPELAGLYAQADANKALGAVPDVPLYRRLGAVRARMGRPAEARAWYGLVLRAAPNDPESLAAVRSLGSP